MSKNAPLLLSANALPRTYGPAEIGGKALNLARLEAFGFAVPQWWVIPCAVFNASLAPLRSRIDAVLKAIDTNKLASLCAAAITIEDLIRDIPLPTALVDELATNLTDNTGDGFAVRSSARGEDEVEVISAGVYESLLEVAPNELSEAIRHVWISGYSESALAYRHRQGLPLAEFSMAVVIQRMIPAVTSGVLFTRDPETGRRTCVLAAAPGLGDGVTADARDTETYRIDWIAKLPPPDPERLVELPPSGSRRLLRCKTIQELKDTGIRTEEALGGPQDIEWAIDSFGRLWMLQSRPQVIALSTQQRRIWDNANIVESFPGLTLPLTYSFARSLYEVTFRGTAAAFFPISKFRFAKLEYFRHLLGYIEGRIYLNLLNWYAMLSYLPGFAGHRRAWDNMFGISQEASIVATPLPFAERAACAWQLAVALLTVRRSSRVFSDWFKRRYADWQSPALDVADEATLMSSYEEILRDVSERWHLTIRNDFCVMTYYGWLRALCRRWIGADDPTLHDALLRGQSNLASVAPYRSLIALAEQFRRHPEGRILLTALSRSGSLDPLLGHADLHDLVRRHLEAYGDRCGEDLKLESCSPREDPRLLFEDIQTFLDRGVTTEDLDAKATTLCTQAENRVKQALRNPIKRSLFWFVLRNTRAAIANREAMRFHRTRLYGVLRRLFRRLGDRLESKDVLTDRLDVHYLTADELIDYCRGSAVGSDLRTLVALRRAEFEKFKTRSPASRMESETSPYVSRFDAQSNMPSAVNCLFGAGCSPGQVRGRARHIVDPVNYGLRKGEIIVAHSTDPGWIYLLTHCGGLVVERGSVLSHTAIIGRELGIPTVVGVTNATAVIPEDAEVMIDGATGLVTWQ